MTRGGAASIVVLLVLPVAGTTDPAERLIDDAARSIRKEAYGPARDSLDAARRLLMFRGSLAAEARAERWLGVLLDATGDVAGAADAFSRAIEASRRAGDRRGEAAVLREIGFGHWGRAEYAEAERMAREALAMQIAAGDAAGEGASLDLLGRIALKDGRTDEAVALFERASNLRSEAGDRRGEVESRLGLLQTRLERREFDRAMDDAQALERWGAASGERDVVVEALDQQAITWIVQGAGDAALECLARARAVASDPPDPALLARVRHLEANARRARGDHEGAIAAHDEAIAAYASLGNRREEAWNLARRARSLAAIGRFAEADASLARALALWESLRERRAFAFWTYERGRLLERAGRYEEAWTAWEDALRLEDEIELPYEALVLSDMAWLAARRGDVPLARTLAERALASAERSGIPEMLWTALYRKGLVERREGRRDRALASLGRCLSVIESMRRRVVPVDEALVGFLENKQEVFAEVVDLLMEMGNTGAALEVGERARARAFLDLLRDRTGGTPDEPPTLASIEDAARRHGSTIVEYFVARARTFVWTVAPGAPLRSITLPVGADDWAEKVATLRTSLGKGADVPVDAGTLLRDLERDLWEPIRPWLPSNPGARVTIVPHGALFALPFSSLVDPEGKYLVETLTIDYAPSVGALVALEARTTDDSLAGGCLAIGNPTLPTTEFATAPPLPALPDAAAEAAFAAEVLGRGPRDLLVGADATESAVRSLAPTRKWIHFATHGIVRDDDPLESALLLAPGPGDGDAEDGRLTAREILDLRLRATLVTLSACESGLGRVTGEGMLGLYRSFLNAGAGSVVVSLWRVSDLVGRFQMGRFYERLAAGDAPSVALRRAQLETLSALRAGTIRAPSGAPLRESPLLWAPYVLMGSGERSE